MSASVAGTRNVEVVGLHKNHFTMVKFESAEDEDYMTVSSHLLLMARAAPTSIARSMQGGSSSSASISNSSAASVPRNVTPSIPAGKKLVPGRYRIQNVQSMALAALRDSSNPSDLVAIIPGLDVTDGDVVSPSFVWIHYALAQP